MEAESERIEATQDEPLPNGGDYAFVFYQDVDGTPSPKNEALRAEVFEYRQNGRLIAMTILDLTGEDDD